MHFKDYKLLMDTRNCTIISCCSVWSSLLPFCHSRQIEENQAKSSNGGDGVNFFGGIPSYLPGKHFYCRMHLSNLIIRPRPRGLTKSLRYSFRSLFKAGVSGFIAGGVGGWLRSHFKAGVSQFITGSVECWL